jgi:hypothetical protein
MADKNPFALEDRPLTPSRSKLGREKRVSAVEATRPADPNQGWPIRDWLTVLATVHPSNPTTEEAAVVGGTCTLRPWRWRQYASFGSGQPQGQWYADEEWTIALDGDQTNGEPMERTFTNNASDRLYFQLIAIDIPGEAGTPIVSIGLYGLSQIGEAFSTTQLVGGGAGGGGGPVVLPPAALLAGFDKMAQGDALYSNIRGDFTATYTTATTLTLAALPFAVAEEDIVAIGKKAIGSATLTDIRWRGKDLNVDYNAGTGVVTIAAGWPMAATDLLTVWIEGPPRTYTEATDSKRIEEIDPTTQQYVGTEHIIDEANIAAATYVQEFSMIDYAHFSLQVLCSGGVTMTLWVSNDPARNVDGANDNGWEQIAAFGPVVDGGLMFFVDTEGKALAYRVKYITADNTNAVDAYLVRWSI